MRRILTVILSLGIVGAVVFGITQAFFSDTETSTGNILQAGSLDLKIDNTCCYNGRACVDGRWIGNNEHDNFNGNDVCSCSWKSKDLDGELFFDLHDLKPGDWEEDTISFDIENPAWLCGDAVLTANDDVTCTNPEQKDEQGLCEDPGAGLGELAKNLNFVFWVDDGDNVFETDEAEGVLHRGTAETVFGGQDKWLKGDAGSSFAPIGPRTFYIAKYFCFGEIGETPLAQDDGAPAERGSGFTCDGSKLDNQTQTDNLIVDFKFYAEQSRHNDDFSCTGERPSITPSPSPSPTLSPTPPLSCNNADVMLVLDRSGSIDSGELATLKTAAKSFVDTLALSSTGNHAGQSSFSTTGSLDHHLSDNSVTLKAAIDALVSSNFTNLKEGIELATGEQANPGDGHDRADVTSPDKMVIITDGNPNRPLDGDPPPDVDAKNAADAAKAAGIEIFVVGIGGDVDATYLTNDIATAGAGHYFSGANYTDLQTILDNLDLCH